MKNIFASLVLCAVSTVGFAQQLISPNIIAGSENAVITNNGRYFVAAEFGVYEVSKTSGVNGSDCSQDASGLYACLVLEPKINGQSCFPTGMTTNGSDLYASCTLGDPTDPDAAAFFRMVPGAGVGLLSDVDSREYASAIWYNGMAVDSAGDVYMSASSASFPQASIVKLQFTDIDNLDFTISDWKIAMTEVLPNGIQIEGNTMYYVSGQSVYAVDINSDGSAGGSRLMYKTVITQIIDDLVILESTVVVGEGALLGNGFNKLVHIKKNANWWNRPVKQSTGSVQVSSLVRDSAGVVAMPGSLVATSYFQGGIHQF